MLARAPAANTSRGHPGSRHRGTGYRRGRRCLGARPWRRASRWLVPWPDHRPISVPDSPRVAARSPCPRAGPRRTRRSATPHLHGVDVRRRRRRCGTPATTPSRGGLGRGDRRAGGRAGRRLLLRDGRDQRGARAGRGGTWWWAAPQLHRAALVHSPSERAHPAARRRYRRHGPTRRGPACARAPLLWLESPTNPTLEVADLPALVEATHAPRAWSSSTTPSPPRCCSVRSSLGADVVVHSATKYRRPLRRDAGRRRDPDDAPTACSRPSATSTAASRARSRRGSRCAGCAPSRCRVERRRPRPGARRVA